jgi:hypothetical protein
VGQHKAAVAAFSKVYYFWLRGKIARGHCSFVVECIFVRKGEDPQIWQQEIITPPHRETSATSAKLKEN